MLDKYRNKVERIINPIASKIKLEANFLSYLSLLFAIFSGISSYFSYEIRYLLLVSSFFIIINGFLDAIDGEIARIRKKESKKGDFIDHSIDRFSDVFMLGGIAISPWINKIIGIASLSIVLLISYLGTQAQAIGYKRVYSGLLGRADRILILFISLIIQFFVQYKIFGFFLIEWVMLYFIFAGLITIIQRYFEIIKWLEFDK
ncbi:MAG: CDP-alcohol phosphatidyltransferase family protein [Thermoplasmatales archaeon]|nr:CDP-alcohol phosphatidyltransferase family protein [Thermoplasmatales archaeon]